MDANERECYLDDVAERVVGAAYRVSNALGPGFMEKVYERALLIELLESGIRARTQGRYPIFYRGQNVGTYYADLVVEDRIIVELKCVDSFSNEHLAQCLNYLRASNLTLALLINFQKPKVEWKRLVLGK
jgi:GxxExxY protein